MEKRESYTVQHDCGIIEKYFYETPEEKFKREKKLINLAPYFDKEEIKLNLSVLFNKNGIQPQIYELITIKILTTGTKDDLIELNIDIIDKKICIILTYSESKFKDYFTSSTLFFSTSSCEK